MYFQTQFVGHFKILLFASVALNLYLVRISNGLVFDDHPLNSTVEAKGAVSLTCIVEFDKKDANQYNMKWKKDGEYIASDRDVKIDLKDQSHFIVTINKGNTRIVYTLMFTTIQNNDRGFYICDVFKNNNRILESNKAFLDVIQIPDERYPLCSISNDIYTEGDDVMLYCISEYTEPPLTLRWTDGDTHVVQIEGQTARLQKRMIANSHLNRYQAVCLLTNSQIPSLQRNCTTQPLTIYYKPRINISQPGLIPTGRQAIFICKTTANPTVTSYKWTTIPTLDNTQYNIDETGQVFMLLNPTYNHNGIMITCEAKNKIGSSSFNFTITIQAFENDKTENKDSNKIDSRKNDKSSRDYGNFNDDASSGLSTDIIVIIIVACVVFVVIMAMIPVYYYCLCSRNSSSNQTTIAHQPEVYFEPRDRMTLPLPHTRDTAIWRRSFGAQAPDDKEVDAMYLEIQSNHYIYATASRCNTIR
ncbi:kin of IRRE-like protein 1 [Anneissia japonica]|uniref:kin of IRRE-like protein 1 n=1 Tax=Anneissia japonica TaxID=1529436 RepID=UPI001425A3A7|nr:kin of IRRE-like protein 1 [Anneissia japonica]